MFSGRASRHRGAAASPSRTVLQAPGATRPRRRPAPARSALDAPAARGSRPRASLLGDPMRLRLRRDLRLDERRTHVARADGSDRDAVRCPLEGQRLDEPEHAVLRRDIPRLERARQRDRGRRRSRRSGRRRSPCSAGHAYFASRNGLVRSTASSSSHRSSAELGVSVRRAGDRRSGSRRPESRTARPPRRPPRRSRPCVARSASKVSPGPSVVGTPVDREHPPTVCDQSFGDRATDAARRPGDERRPHPGAGSPHRIAVAAHV